MNRKGGRNFTAYSAGSHPSGFVRPEAIRQLDAAHLPPRRCVVNPGMSSHVPIHRRLILSLPFATTRLRKYVRFGLASR